MSLLVVLCRRFGRAQFAGLLLGFTPAAHAHRLDELLQRSFIAVEPARISIEITLTPGVGRADEFVASLDPNHDGKISSSEGETFAATVGGQLALFIDGQRLALTVGDVSVPDLDAVRTGVGDLQIQFTAALPDSPRGARALRFSNNYLPAGSVYLATAFAPAGPNIRIGPLRRDEAQQSLAFDFTIQVRPTPAPTRPHASAALRP